MSEITLDFETASLADLTVVGSSIYAQHITTEILNLAWQLDDEVPITWTPTNRFCHDALALAAADPNHIFIAFNAGFEKDIWRYIMVERFGFPDIPNDRWHDIAATCALKTWPLGLDNALHTAGLPGKDMAASKFTTALSRPNKKTGMLDRSPESLARASAYGRDDVIKERALHKRIGYLPPMERKVWLISEEINERGVQFDMSMVAGALKIYEAAKRPLIEEFREITGVNPTQVERFKDWLAFNAVDLPNMRKETVNKLLGLADEGEDDEDVRFTTGGSDTGELLGTLPAVVRRALTIRALIGHSSVKKFARMEKCADQDGRIRRLLQYHGAGPGRFAGRLFNAHNMPRGLARVDAGFDDKGRPKAKPPDPELLAQAITTGDVAAVDALACFIEHGPNRVPANPIEVLASALRNTIVSKAEYSLLIGDWSSIEARLVLAIAGQHDKCALLAGGMDAYLDMAEQIFNERGLTKADTEKRQTGKNTILGCGFQMGSATFHARYCSDRPIEFAERAIEAYRKEWAPEVPKLWWALQKAALEAVSTPGKLCDSGYGITYQVVGDWLVGTCPDGSQLHYFRPTLCRRAMPWSTEEKPDIRLTWRYQVGLKPHEKSDIGLYDRATHHGHRAQAGQWVSAYGGLLTENYIQHMARQLLVRALGLCRLNNLPVILHNQDEIIAEVEDWCADKKLLQQIMEDRPRWATAIQLPLQVEVHDVCKRYHK